MLDNIYFYFSKFNYEFQLGIVTIQSSLLQYSIAYTPCYYYKNSIYIPQIHYVNSYLGDYLLTEMCYCWQLYGTLKKFHTPEEFILPNCMKIARNAVFL